MPEKKATEGQEGTTNPAKTTKPEKEKATVDYSKKYAGKKMFLTDKNMVCMAAGVHFSRIPDDRGQTTQAIKVIPEGLSPLAYEEVNKFAELGIIALADDYSDKEIDKMVGMTSQDSNEPSTVEDLSQYDTLLNLDAKSLERELGIFQKEIKKPREWFKGLLDEERYSGKRENYIELISKFV